MLGGEEFARERTPEMYNFCVKNIVQDRVIAVTDPSSCAANIIMRPTRSEVS